MPKVVLLDRLQVDPGLNSRSWALKY